MNPIPCKVILAGSIAKSLQAEVAEGRATLASPPRLLGFLANEDPAAKMYADWTRKTCEDRCVEISQVPACRIAGTLTETS